MNWVLKHTNPENGSEGSIYKIMNIGIPKCIIDLIPKHEIGNSIRDGNNLIFFIAELKVLQIHFSHIQLRLAKFRFINSKSLIYSVSNP